MKNNYKFLLLLLLCGMSIASCKKFLQIPPPTTQMVGSAVFNDDQSATSALVDIYLNMSASGNGFASFNMTRLGGMYTDEMTYSKVQHDLEQFVNGHLNNDNSFVGSTWQEIYTYIYQTNAVIEGLASSSGVSESVKTHLTAEARFIRAFCYFHLANLFGDVPLVMTTNYKANAKLARTPVATVNAQVISDLKASIGGLGDDQGAGQRVRASDWAARALLARVYLYAGDWNNALLYSDSVINSGVFPFSNDLSQIFLVNSPEAIWQLASGISIPADTWDGYSFVPSSTTILPQYILTNSLLNAFEPGDARAAYWIGFNTIENINYYYAYKYKSNTQLGTEYHVVLRSTEQYLIRAECEAALGNTDACLMDLNMIRTRAGLAPLGPSATPGYYLNAILHERRVEFFAENGHRFFDLVRTGQADAVLGIKPNWTPDSKLWPVPLAELKTNPSLVQNRGY